MTVGQEKSGVNISCSIPKPFIKTNQDLSKVLPEITESTKVGAVTCQRRQESGLKPHNEHASEKARNITSGIN